MIDHDHIEDRRAALAAWAECTEAEINWVEGYEFTTPNGIFYVLDDDEATDMADEEAERDWEGLASRLSYSKAYSKAGLHSAQADYWSGIKAEGRGTQIHLQGSHTMIMTRKLYWKLYDASLRKIAKYLEMDSDQLHRMVSVYCSKTGCDAHEALRHHRSRILHMLRNG